jgi:hypothetical protein
VITGNDSQLERAVLRAKEFEKTLVFLRDKLTSTQAQKNGLDVHEVAGFLRVVTSCLAEAPKIFDAEK